MKKIALILNIILISTYFINLYLNHNSDFYFYFTANIVIFGFFTLFNFLETQFIKNFFTTSDLKILKIFNLVSILSIIIYILFYLMSVDFKDKYNILFYLYTLNIIMFAYFGYKISRISYSKNEISNNIQNKI